MTKHAWVELQYMPVEAEIDEDTGDVTITSSQEAVQVAQEEAIHGCFICNQPLTTETAGTECPGSDEQKEV